MHTEETNTPEPSLTALLNTYFSFLLPPPALPGVGLAGLDALEEKAKRDRAS